MKVPVIIAAFGTTSKARAVYEKADALLRVRFIDHEIYWTFTSRMVRHNLKNRNIDIFTPGDQLAMLAEHGHKWAVVQSFNMICGHEFHRLVQEVQSDKCRVSIGHSLLCSQEDHRAVARAMSSFFKKDNSEAVVMVGHGTDHCIWTVYPAFFHLLREMYGERAYGGTIEQEYPSRDILIDQIKTAGFRRVRLVPFMLVAGVHFLEDLAGPEDSWKSSFEDKGLDVELETEGLGSQASIIEIFWNHIQDALSVIPDSKNSMG